jgi:prolyl-tRNA synthetase
MRVGKYFLPLLKEDPVGAEVISHKLMLRAGMIRQQSSGIYVWLPLGLKVLTNIARIIREEMDAAGALEVLMPCIQPASLWRESNRYDSYGKEMLRITDRHENEMLFGPTNEEVIHDIVRNNIKSYKELPKTFYQIQWKFRDEIRPRFGLMRGREFYMKDAYSFDVSEAAAIESYDQMMQAYIKIFKRLGLKGIPVKADSGPIGGNVSHEFHVLASTGESTAFYDSAIEAELAQDDPDVSKIKSMYAMADEMHDPSSCPVETDQLVTHKSIEVGHIFYLGIKYSEPMKVVFMNQQGVQQPCHSGCYGIGVSRLVATIIESSHDNRGIIWPASVAPFQVSLINLNMHDAATVEVSEKLYRELCDAGIDVLYDDSTNSAGAKLAAHDLIGIPHHIIIGPRLLAQNKAELKLRQDGSTEEVSIEAILQKLRQKIL